MEETIIVKSQRYHIGKGLLTFFIIVAVILLIWPISTFTGLLLEYNSCMTNVRCSFAQRWGHCRHDLFGSAVAYAFSDSSFAWTVNLSILIGIGLMCVLIYAWLHSYEMIITDRRVYGKAAFGKRVDLPMDFVSAIGSKWPKGISVATSSGKISFLMIKNCSEIHKCVSDLLIKRQNKPVSAPVPTPIVKQDMPISNADELRKFKELLDSGVITEEEFDAKKKQLLGL